MEYEQLLFSFRFIDSFGTLELPVFLPIYRVEFMYIPDS